MTSIPHLDSALQSQTRPAASESAEGAGSQRLVAIDMLRGVAMLLMALDHWAAFARINLMAEGYNGKRFPLGNWAEILTGLISNLSSGIFFTLAGTSIAFFERSRRKRGWTEWDITRFLLIRAGILLILDQVVNFVGWHVTNLPLFEVLSAIAFSIIVLSVARLLPLRIVALLSAALFVLFPLFVQVFPHNPDQPLSAITTILFQNHRDQGFPEVEDPLLGRVSLMLAGYVMGRLLSQGKISISPRWLWAALAGFIVWFVLRLGLLQGYGDFLPYQAGAPWIDFFIDNKHPPSLTFLLFNMSWSLVALVFINAIAPRLSKTWLGWALSVLGQTSLFFFVFHMLFYRLLVTVFSGGVIIPPSWLGNIDLLRLFIECGLTFVILLPVCAWYRNLRRKHVILSYL